MEKTITKTKIKVELDQELSDLVKTKNKAMEEKQVIIHFTYEAFWATGIRIWPTTYLFAHGSEHRSHLLSNLNIPLAPTWKYLTGAQPATFTLVFSALPGNTEKFDMVEVLPLNNGGGAFKAFNIVRNETDVYTLTLD
jgi:hypothetical protein